VYIHGILSCKLRVSVGQTHGNKDDIISSSYLIYVVVHMMSYR